MNILFVDDDPDHVEHVARTLVDALDAHVRVVSTVDEAIEALHSDRWQLVVMDVFIPMETATRQHLGPRARRHKDDVAHLGGLVLLDELDRIDPAPTILSHTQCTDAALIEILGERVTARVPKPAPVDVLLRAVLVALDLPVPG